MRKGRLYCNRRLGAYKVLALSFRLSLREIHLPPQLRSNFREATRTTHPSFATRNPPSLTREGFWYHRKQKTEIFISVFSIFTRVGFTRGMNRSRSFEGGAVLCKVGEVGVEDTLGDGAVNAVGHDAIVAAPLLEDIGPEECFERVGGFIVRAVERVDVE